MSKAKVFDWCKCYGGHKNEKCDTCMTLCLVIHKRDLSEYIENKVIYNKCINGNVEEMPVKED